jgi:lipoprotein signal peptidase
MSTPGADAFAGVLTQVLVHGTVLATMTWLLCAVFLRRVRPAVHVVLWTVVLLKFLIPPVFPGLVSLSGWLSSASSSLGFSGSGGSAQGVIVLEESLDLTAVAAPGGSFSFFESLASWLSANLSALALFVYVTILGLLVVRSAVRTL